MRPLRVTFVAPFGVRRRGTTRARVIPLAAALARRGHEVEVLIPEWDCLGDAGRRYAVGGAEVRHLAVAPGGDRPLSARLLLRTYRAALERQPDIVHCFKPIGYSGGVALLLRHATPRSRWGGLLAIDTDDLEGRAGWATRAGRQAWQVALIDNQERWCIRAGRLVTAASRYLVARASEWRGCRRGIAYLPNGAEPFDRSMLRPGGASSHEAVKLLLYTRFNEFSPARGARLVAAILRRVPGARLTVVGDGESVLRDEFTAGLTGAGCRSRVRFAGLLEGADRRRALASCDVALWPFDDTAINRARSPVKLLELLAAGAAVVAHNVGEVRALACSGARLVPAGADEAFTEAVAELAADEAARARLGAGGRTASARANWERRAHLLERSYLASR